MEQIINQILQSLNLNNMSQKSSMKEYILRKQQSLPQNIAKQINKDKQEEDRLEQIINELKQSEIDSDEYEFESKIENKGQSSSTIIKPKVQKTNQNKPSYYETPQPPIYLSQISQLNPTVSFTVDQITEQYQNKDFNNPHTITSQNIKFMQNQAQTNIQSTNITQYKQEITQQIKNLDITISLLEQQPHSNDQNDPQKIYDQLVSQKLQNPLTTTIDYEIPSQKHHLTDLLKRFNIHKMLPEIYIYYEKISLFELENLFAQSDLLIKAPQRARFLYQAIIKSGFKLYVRDFSFQGVFLASLTFVYEHLFQLPVIARNYGQEFGFYVVFYSVLREVSGQLG